MNENTKVAYNMVANVIVGENSFMPTGLTQWIALALLVLAGVFMVMKVFNIDKRYHAKPMKHD